MSDLLKPGGKTLAASDITSLLKSYNLWSAFLRGVCVDEAIAEIQLTEEEGLLAWRGFCEKHQVEDASTDEQCFARFAMNRVELLAFAQRRLRIEKLKLQKFTEQLSGFFLKRKSALDRVVYSILRVKEAALARELYFRIKENEQPFGELAAQYSGGPEAHTGGLVGPVALASLAPALAESLRTSELGQLWPPAQMGEWFVVVRLEKQLPAQLDEATKAQLLSEMFEGWVENQIRTRLAAKP